jgi:DNA primase
VFATKPQVWESEVILITEAPIDALSLATCGYAALALIGTHFPPWLPRACAWRQVLLATDADAAGDAAAEKLAEALAHYGAKPARLRPAAGKDWNELLQAHGAPTLHAELTQIILPRLLK